MDPRTRLSGGEPEPAAVAQPFAPGWGQRRVEARTRCSHCGQRAPRFVRDRCAACYGYWHKHGHERPPELARRCFTGRLEAVESRPGLLAATEALACDLTPRRSDRPFCQSPARTATRCSRRGLFWLQGFGTIGCGAGRAGIYQNPLHRVWFPLLISTPLESGRRCERLDLPPGLNHKLRGRWEIR
jgi:hypothetical protein